MNPNRESWDCAPFPPTCTPADPESPYGHANSNPLPQQRFAHPNYVDQGTYSASDEAQLNSYRQISHLADIRDSTDPIQNLANRYGVPRAPPSSPPPQDQEHQIAIRRQPDRVGDDSECLHCDQPFSGPGKPFQVSKFPSSCDKCRGNRQARGHGGDWFCRDCGAFGRARDLSADPDTQFNCPKCHKVVAFERKRGGCIVCENGKTDYIKVGFQECEGSNIGSVFRQHNEKLRMDCQREPHRQQALEQEDAQRREQKRQQADEQRRLRVEEFWRQDRLTRAPNISIAELEQLALQAEQHQQQQPQQQQQQVAWHDEIYGADTESSGSARSRATSIFDA